MSLWDKPSPRFPNNMRIFCGTTIPLDSCELIRVRVGTRLNDPGWRVAPMAQWHVTALFIGERDAASLTVVQAAVARIAQATPPISLLNGRLVTMPKDDPTMLWVRFQPEPALTSLHLALAQASGTEPSTYRPYWPHITLARSRKAAPVAMNGELILETLVLDRISLFRSDPSTGGTVHTELATWPLTGTDPVDHETVA